MKRKTPIDKNSGSVLEADATPDGSPVARKAYELWEARGCPEGDALRDWLEAERTLAGARQVDSAAKDGREDGERKAAS